MLRVVAARLGSRVIRCGQSFSVETGTASQRVGARSRPRVHRHPPGSQGHPLTLRLCTRLNLPVLPIPRIRRRLLRHRDSPVPQVRVRPSKGSSSSKSLRAAAIDRFRLHLAQGWVPASTNRQSDAAPNSHKGACATPDIRYPKLGYAPSPPIVPGIHRRVMIVGRVPSFSSMEADAGDSGTRASVPVSSRWRRQRP